MVYKINWFKFFSFRFFKQGLLNAHAKISHIKEKTVSCDFCAKRFTIKYSLKTHIIHSHSTKSIEKVQCHVCDAWLCSKAALKKHIFVHNADPIKCEFCDTTLANKFSFGRHNRMFHKNGGLNLECHSCTKTFRNRNDLLISWNIINFSGPYKCAYERKKA